MRTLRSSCLALVSLVAILAMPAHAGGPATAGVALGFARVNLGDGTVSAFGGKGTKTVTTGPTSTGLILYFNGKYPKNIVRELVIAQATAEGDVDHPVALANAIVSIANATQIAVSLNGWNADSADAFDGFAFVTLYAGVAPED
ncbi:MAG TPA: hypothetical protein VMR86_16645 [Myxococcota bacterium]|nr:hypothetical protein [Myxococcota bacterium]